MTSHRYMSLPATQYSSASLLLFIQRNVCVCVNKYLMPNNFVFVPLPHIYRCYPAHVQMYKYTTRIVRQQNYQTVLLHK